MVLNTFLAGVAAAILLGPIAAIVRIAGGGSLLTLVVQTIIIGGAGYALFSVSFIPFATAVAMAAFPLGMRLFAIIWFWRIGRKTLNGDYGEEARWAGEFVDEEDEEFIEASAQLTQMELREAGIVADDKEELRTQVLSRANEKDD